MRCREGHDQRAESGEGAAAEDEPVGAHAVHDQAHENVRDGSRDGRREEAEGGLDGAEVLHFLEEKCEDCLEGVEGAPG